MAGGVLALLLGAGPAGADEPSVEELVADAQRMLRLAGYDPGPEDGKVGPRTEQAIRAYQRATRIEVSHAWGELGLALPALKPDIR